MKFWHPFSSLLIVALLVTCSDAQQYQPYGVVPPTTVTRLPRPQVGVAPVNYQAGYGAQPGYPASNYGAPLNLAATQAPSYGIMAPAAPASATSYVNGSAAATQASAPGTTEVLAAPSAAAGYASTASVGTGAACGGAACGSAPAAGVYAGNDYFNAMNAPWSGASCGPVAAPAAPCCPRWFGGVYGLIMDRVNSDRVYFLRDPGLPSRLYLSSRDASMSTSGGVEARIGKTFCNCKWGLEGVYWGLFPDDQFATVTAGTVAAPTVYTTHNYSDVYFDNGMGPQSIDSLYNDGSILTAALRRSFEYQNVEINLLSGPLVPAPSCGGGCGGCGGRGGCGALCADNCGQCSRWQAGWLFGVRYFKIDEDFMLGYDNGDGIIDYSYTGGTTEFFQEVQTSNNLVGVQLGLNLDYCITRCLQLDFGSKFGFYGNHMTTYQRIFDEFGPAYVNPGAAQDFVLNSSDNNIAFLGELRAGVGYKVGCHWRLTGGYRAVAASNVALPLHQLPVGQTLGALDHVKEIKHDASLILHGAYAGVEFAW